MNPDKELTEKKILEKAKWNNDTAYTGQITYICDDGYMIHSVYIEGNNTRREAELTLVEKVQEHFSK